MAFDVRGGAEPGTLRVGAYDIVVGLRGEGGAAGADFEAGELAVINKQVHPLPVAVRMLQKFAQRIVFRCPKPGCSAAEDCHFGRTFALSDEVAFGGEMKHRDDYRLAVELSRSDAEAVPTWAEAIFASGDPRVKYSSLLLAAKDELCLTIGQFSQTIVDARVATLTGNA